jgi:hypothetical protein
MKVHEPHLNNIYPDHQIMIGIVKTDEGTRIQMAVCGITFVMTPDGAEWLADVLNRTADKVRLPVEALTTG